MGSNNPHRSQLPMAMARLALICAVGLSACAHVERTHYQGATSPDEAMRMMRLSWNNGAVGQLERAFAPARRALVRAQAKEIRARMGQWALVSWRFSELCHHRGERFKLVDVRMKLENLPDDERRVIEHHEALWLVYERGRWWLYSL